MWILNKGPIVGACLVYAGLAFADGVDKPSNATMRSLDDQVQQIKSDVLDIAAELSLLEEQLLYPSNTQLAIFVAFEDETEMRLDAMQLTLDAEPATHHIYSFKELEALQQGGVQRLYTGNIDRGEHQLEVQVIGKTKDGKEVVRHHNFTFTKSIEPSMLGLTLAGTDGSQAELSDW